MRNVGSGVYLYAKIAAASEGSSGSVAGGPLRYVLQRHSHRGERRFHARQRDTVWIQTAVSDVGPSQLCQLPSISCRPAHFVLLQYRRHPHHERGAALGFGALASSPVNPIASATCGMWVADSLTRSKKNKRGGHPSVRCPLLGLPSRAPHPSAFAQLSGTMPPNPTLTEDRIE